MQVVSALLAGLVFGIGLIVSGMINPQKVQNFLDVFGAWDPSLAFVMGGAIAVAAPGFWLVLRRARPLFAQSFSLPQRRDIDARLVSGATLFGIGWGLSGYCPGPALTALPLLSEGTVVFVAALVAGFWLAKRLRPQAPAAVQAPT